MIKWIPIEDRSPMTNEDVFLKFGNEIAVGWCNRGINCDSDVVVYIPSELVESTDDRFNTKFVKRPEAWATIPEGFYS